MRTRREVDQAIGTAESLVLRALADATGTPYVRLWNADFTKSSPVPDNWHIETKENWL